MLEKLFRQIMQRENTREAISQFRAEIKEEGAFLQAKALVGDGEQLRKLLDAEDAKVRKNAAALIGDLKLKEAAEALYAAYQKEEKLFVRPALLRALAQTNPGPYLKELHAQHALLCSRTQKEEEKKHIREELHALERLLRQEEAAERHIFTGWEKKHLIFLTTYPGCAKLTAEQFSAYRKGITPYGVQAVVDHLRDIISIRTFRELLFPIALGCRMTLEDGPKALGASLAKAKLLPLLQQNHAKQAPYRFRFEMRCGLSLEERSRYVKRAAAAAEEASGRQLVNAPEDYEFEVRLVLSREGYIQTFLKMMTIPMERFSYRKESVSSSMHPSLAATLVRLAKPYLKKRARVLDPCCGVGTLLIEREMLLPTKEMYGVDLFGEAIAKARVHMEEAGLDAYLIQKDFLEFMHAGAFDEIIADLPVRGKRTKEEQDAFYRSFFDQAEALLAPDGVLLLYSNENGFVRKQLRLHPAFRLYQEYPMQEKGKFSFYIIGMGMSS